MKLVDRTVRARLSVLTPRDSGAFIAAQPNMEGSSRPSWRHLGAGAGRLAGGRVAAQLMRMAAAAGIAGLFGAPLALAQNLGTVALGSSSSATAVTVTVAIGGTLDNISVSTQGVSNLDFSNTGGGTCAVSTAYSSAQSCTVEVTFSPTAPGMRLGAVTLHDSSGDLLGTGYVYGTGTGSLLRYNPGTQTVLYSALNAPQAMVVDAGSNIYIADTVNTRVLKLPWNGSGYGTPVTVGTGWSAPSGVAVDGAGNVYVADANLDSVVEVPWTGSAYGTQFDIAGTYPSAQDLTIDGSGNLYILTSATTITKLPWNGSGYGTSSTIGSGFSGGRYNTDFVDGSGNIYVADYTNGNAVKETPSGSSYNQTILGNFGAPSIDGIATDPAGNVYLANYIAHTVLMLPWTGSGYDPPITLTSNGALHGPEAIYLDGIGNIYIEDYDNNLVEKWSVTDLPTLTFSTSTAVGSLDAADGPQTFSLLNVGNAALSILVPSAGDNPSIASGFSFDSSSTCPQLSTSNEAATLASAASCTYAVNFTPTEGGTNSGALLLTDNYEGATSATQSIGLSGTGISAVTKLAFGIAPATPIALGGNAGSSVTVDEETTSSVIDTAATDAITLTVTGPSSYSHMYTATAVDGVATFNLSSVAMSASGSYTYTASLTSVTSATALETVNNTTPQTISFSPSSPVAYGVAPITLSATGGASGNAVTFSITSGNGFGSLSGTNNSTLTITGAGTITIAANQAGNTNYSAATQVTASIVVTSVAQTITFTPSTPVTYGAAPITLSATGGASGNPVTFSITSGSSFGSLSGTNNSTLTITGAGTIVITANQAGGTDYSAATAVTASIVVSKVSQTIAFTPLTPVTYGAAPITLSATGGASGNPVTFSITSGNSFGSLSGTNSSTLTITGAGTITIAANQAGNTNYAAATQVTASIVVSTVAQTITFSPSSPVTYGVAPITLSATGGASGNPVTFSITSGNSFGSLSGTNNSTLTITGAGTITIAANQAGNTDYSAATQVMASIVVANVSQTITFSPSSPMTYGVAPIKLNATGGASGNAVTFSYVSGPGSLSGTNNSTLTLTGAGTIVVTANQAGATGYSAATAVTASIVVSKVSQTIAFTPSSPVTYGVAPITLSATGGASGDAVTFSITSGNGFGSLSGTNNSTLTITGAGTITIAASQAGNTNYAAATQVTASIVVSTVAQTITFTPSSPVAYGAAPITLSATGGASGNPVTFGYVSGPGTLSGTNNSTLTLTGAGTIVVTANQAGGSDYSAATAVTASIIVSKVSQTIAFTPSSPVTYGVAPITLSATGGASGDAVTFSITSGNGFGSLSGTNNSTLTITGAGTITIAASQAGNTNYAAATQVTASIVVSTVTQTITFTPSSPVAYGAAPITLSATGGASGNPVTFGYVSGPGSLSGTNNSTLTLTGAGTIVVTANQAGGSDYSAATAVTASIVVSKVSQTIAFPSLSPVIYGVAPIALSATGGASGDAVTFSITSGNGFGSLSGTNNSTLTITGAGTITIAANQAGNTNYAAATQVTVSIVVSTVAQTITFSPSSPVTYGVAPIALSATGGASGDPVTFSITSGNSFGSLSGTNNSTLTITGAGTITIAANQAGNTDYSAATQVMASIVVANVSQTITFSPSSPVTYGVAPIKLNATGGASGNAVTFSITSGGSLGSLSGTNGNTLTITGSGTITIAANQAGNTDYGTAAQATASILVSKAALSVLVNPASSVYGAAFPTFSGTLTTAIPGDGITASYSTTATPASPAGGSYSIIATLSDPNSKLGNYSVTNTPAALTILSVTSSVQLTSSMNPVLLSDPTTLTATISSAAGQPTGTVNFLDNATPIGSASLSNGVATLILSSLMVGSHSLSAVYSSNTDFSPSTSGVLIQSVIDFSTTAGGSGSGSGASQTGTPGTPVTFSLAIVPTGGTSFPTPAVLTITGMPPGATATLSPLSWAQTSSTSWTYPANIALTDVALTIHLASATARMDGKVPFRRAVPPVLWALLLIPFSGRLRRKFSRLGQTLSVLLLLAAGCAVVTGVSGCGSRNGFFNQPQQTYTMNVTVSSGALSHSSTITLTVE
jgi:Bacterial Ig-like domain (group 3)/MBG domain (YGX type)